MILGETRVREARRGRSGGRGGNRRRRTHQSSHHDVDGQHLVGLSRSVCVVLSPETSISRGDGQLSPTVS